MQNSADSLNEGISPRWYTTEQVALMLGYGLTKTKHLILSGQIRSVDWNMKPVQRWYEAHWPLFVPPDDLRKARDAVREEIKKRKLAANPLAVELDDEDEPKKPADTPSWMDPKQPLPRELVAQRFKNYVDGFMVHPDRTSLTLVVRPSGTSITTWSDLHPATASADPRSRR